MKKRFIFLLFLGILFSMPFMTSKIAALSKVALEDMVMNHEFRIESLEKNNSSAEKLDSELKQSLLNEAEMYTSWQYWENGQLQEINITGIDIVERNGELTLQIFTEGNNGWGYYSIYYETEGEIWLPEPGRDHFESFIRNFKIIEELYQVELDYEIYENGNKVKFSL
ncbi:hypothetical protein [Mesobacillus maritimus]|uniref:hypothetical protein n=1 Tax=Mesobacillus maritimus TaxID=1643336 RepID=UPI00384B7B0E